MDSLYVRDGYYFQLYSGTSESGNPDGLVPYGPLMAGPQYVSIDCWETSSYIFEPGTFFVEGRTGDLKDYSIIIYRYNPDTAFTKVDDLDDFDCRGPENEITYTLCCDNITDQSFTNVSIVDVLPEDVDVVPGSADPEGSYDPDTHSYVWSLGTIAPSNSECVELTVTVNDKAEPGMTVHNVAELWMDVYDANGLNPVPMMTIYKTKDTLVCCWDTINPDIIYVAQTATGNDNGVDWDNAYSGTDGLQKALYRAVNSTCGGSYKIYVAAGMYNPGDSYEPDEYQGGIYTDTFTIPDGVKVYGGFPAGGCAFNLRHPKKYQTILSGYIDEYDRNNTVVTMGNDSVLDGFVVEESIRGIDGSGVSSTVINCSVKNNSQRGISCENGDLTVQWCEIKENGYQGIWHWGSNKLLTVENSNIHDNQYDGIRTEYSTSTILNSLIYQNGLGSHIYSDYYGINLLNPSISPAIRNNTIIENTNEGIRFTGAGNKRPTVLNSIVYYNGGSNQLKGFNPEDAAYYCCIQDCNEPPGTTNMNDVPGFAYTTGPSHLPVAGNYHLKWDSNCANTGDPNLLLYVRQLDMDGEPRVYGTRVDRGADEVVACHEDLTEDDIYHLLDWTPDGVINLEEFSLFSAAWLSYDPIYDLDSDFDVDFDDFVSFCDGWLWKACWKSICYNSYNVLDTNRDGLVNMVEFSQFAGNWQTYSPTDPDWQFWNLDNTGNIDLADLMLFLDNWLWVSCTRADDFPAPLPQSQPAQMPPPEPTNLEQALELHDSICIFNQIWQSDPNMSEQIDPNEWYTFMDSLCVELDNLISSLSEIELMAYDLIAGDDCCTQQEAMSGGEEMFFISEAEEFVTLDETVVLDQTVIDAEAGIQPDSTVEWEESPYTAMSTGELSSLATGIYSVLDAVDTALAEDYENADNLLEIEDFLENVLADIKASR